MSCFVCNGGEGSTKVLVKSKAPGGAPQHYLTVIDAEVCALHAGAHLVLDALRSNRLMVGPGVGAMDVEVLFESRMPAGATLPAARGSLEERLARLERMELRDNVRRYSPENIHECVDPSRFPNTVLRRDDGAWFWHVEADHSDVRVFCCPSCGTRFPDAPPKPPESISAA